MRQLSGASSISLLWRCSAAGTKTSCCGLAKDGGLWLAGWGLGDVTLVDDGDHVVEKKKNIILFYYLRNSQIIGFPHGSFWCALPKGLVHI